MAKKPDGMAKSTDETASAAAAAGGGGEAR
jgi:hypothetical protein